MNIRLSCCILFHTRSVIDDAVHDDDDNIDLLTNQTRTITEDDKYPQNSTLTQNMASDRRTDR